MQRRLICSLIGFGLVGTERGCPEILVVGYLKGVGWCGWIGYFMGDFAGHAQGSIGDVQGAGSVGFDGYYGRDGKVLAGYCRLYAPFRISP